MAEPMCDQKTRASVFLPSTWHSWSVWMRNDWNQGWKGGLSVDRSGARQQFIVIMYSLTHKSQIHYVAPPWTFNRVVVKDVRNRSVAFVKYAITIGCTLNSTTTTTTTLNQIRRQDVTYGHFHEWSMAAMRWRACFHWHSFAQITTKYN